MILGDQPWTHVQAALAGDTPVVAILPLGAVEAHGPHLPLCTDGIISEGMARRAAALLAEHAVQSFVLPTLAYAPADYAAEFAGTISIGEATARAVMLDIAASLKAQGFACLALANSHFDPGNVAMLRGLAAELAAIGMPLAFPDFTRRALAAELTEEFVSGACHAGQFETSLVLADRPDLVDGPARLRLPGNPASLVTAFAAGATTFTQAGGPEAYFGHPARATAAEGARTSAIMARAIVDAVLAKLAEAAVPPGD